MKIKTIPQTSHFALVPLAMEYKEEKKKYIPLKNILEDICNCLQVEIEEVQTMSRKDLYVTARKIYCYVARRKTGKTLKQIAYYIGGRDHTTVIHNDTAAKHHISTKDLKFMESWETYLENSRHYSAADFT